ncbi:MAG: hypothetical protein HYZ81_01265 [Nitrospinae bacterium]|nr:hypothetical protein [Nitrospinota bacterium]
MALTATTDVQGSFAIQNIPRSEANSPLILTVSGGNPPAGRTYPASTNAVVSLTSVTAGDPVEPNVVLAGVEIELHDLGGTITGQVLGVNGNPLAGVNVTLDVVQIPVINPGVGVAGPTTGVFPFTLCSAPPAGTPAGTNCQARQTATTNANGVFTFTSVPEDWIYNITIIPGGGAANLTFTNQFVPSGSSLFFPDVVGAPADSAVANALVLAGVLPGGGFAGGLVLAAPFAPVCPPPGGVGCVGVIAAGPVIVVPALLPGDQPDMTAPFIAENSPVVDGTIFAAAQNVPNLALNVTVSEPLGNTVGELQAGLGLTFAGAGTVPVVGAIMGSPIPFLVGLDMAGTTVTVTPQVFDATNKAIPLPAGLYSITMLGVLQDMAGNTYTGCTPNAGTRPGVGGAGFCPVGTGTDAAGAVEFAAAAMLDAELDFVILGDTTLPGAPSVASIMCTDCQNGGMAGAAAFNVTFDAVMGAVQYFGGFATAGDTTFTTNNDNIMGSPPAFLSAGPLADPPENITFTLSGVGVVATIIDFTTTPGFLLGFNYPLVAGTELLAAPISNNYFDDAITYQVGIEAVNLQGIRGPQATALVMDITAPGFDVSGAPGTDPATGLAFPAGSVGAGNNINTVLALVPPPADLVMANMTTSFFPLENIFSATATESMFTAESIQIREGTTAAAGMAIVGTVSFSFFEQVASPPGSMSEFMGVADNFYSMADLAAFLGLPSIGLNVRLNEQISTTTMLTAPTLSSPDPTMLATSPLAFASVDGGMTFMSVTTGLGTDITMAFGNTADGMVNIAFTADGDMIMDEDVIEIQLSDIWATETGDQVEFGTTSGITDEAGNALVANTTLVLANHIPTAITNAVATPGDAASDVLTLTFSRPVFIPATALDAMGNLAVGLGLVDPTGDPLFTAMVGGAMIALSADGQTLTLTTAMQGDLSGLTAATVISGVTSGIGMALVPGTALQTNDALNFLVGAGLGPLVVNTFADGTRADGTMCGVPCVVAIRVEDLIPPTLMDVIDGGFGGTTVNSEALTDGGDMLLQVGDMVMDTFSIGFVFDQAVLSDRNGDGMIDAADLAGVSAAFMGAAANIVFDNAMIDIATSVMDATGMSIFFDAALNPFAGEMGLVATGDTFTITGVTDLAGNATVVNMATLGAVGAGITIP